MLRQVVDASKTVAAARKNAGEGLTKTRVQAREKVALQFIGAKGQQPQLFCLLCCKQEVHRWPGKMQGAGKP
jgi:hypothetical protein